MLESLGKTLEYLLKFFSISVVGLWFIWIVFRLFFRAYYKSKMEYDQEIKKNGEVKQ